VNSKPIGTPLFAMGEFHDAVSTLLEAFAHGIAIIKRQRGRRKKDRLPIEPTKKNAEAHLSKSLKKNRTDVRKAYGRDLARYGPDFATGDAEAQSSLSAILFRLNAGFVSIIERFTRGRSTSTDYQALLNLSNASRMEAINTFEQLSQRLSRSSLALVPSGTGKDLAKHRTHHRRRETPSSAMHVKHSRSKSAPELSLTALGPAKTDGWVRPKAGRKLSSDSRSSKASGSSTPRRPSPKTHSPQPSKSIDRTSLPSSRRGATRVQRPLEGHSAKTDNRKSFMSFATDSTKLGEIPEHKWARPAMLQAGQFPVTTYYPLEPYREPEKQKSRFMRFFRRSNED